MKVERCNLEGGVFHGDYGLLLSESHKHYGVGASLPRPVDNAGKVCVSGCLTMIGGRLYVHTYIDLEALFMARTLGGMTAIYTREYGGGWHRGKRDTPVVHSCRDFFAGTIGRSVRLGLYKNEKALVATRAKGGVCCMNICSGSH